MPHASDARRDEEMRVTGVGGLRSRRARGGLGVGGEREEGTCEDRDGAGGCV